MRVQCVILVPTLFCALASNSQGMNRSAVSQEQNSYQLTQEAEPPKPVQPYTAHFKITRVIPLGDGSIRTLVSTETDARDCSGRRYWGTNKSFLKGDHEEWKLDVRVEYPSRHTSLTWDSRSHAASLFKIPEKAALAGCWADANGTIRETHPEKQDWYPIPPSPSAGRSESIASVRLGSKQYKMKRVVENLGKQTINGQIVFGVKTTFTPLEGDTETESFESTNELWKSTDLNLTMRETSNGPKQGLKQRELIDLKLGDPDPSLFEPPAGYEIETVALHQLSCTQ